LKVRIAVGVPRERLDIVESFADGELTRGSRAGETLDAVVDVEQNRRGQTAHVVVALLCQRLLTPRLLCF
jgi:hypothetical protein